MVKSIHSQELQRVTHDRAMAALRSLPPFSPVLDRVLASLTGEDVSLSQLAALIEKDVVMSGRILQLVNSAAYARREPITSVPRALSVLGFDKLRNTILGLSVGRIWGQARTPASFSMARFGAHSAATAAMSDLLAQRVRMEFPEGAFVAGLLHDIGHLLIAVGLPESYEPAQGREYEVLGFTHEDIGAEALNFWKLPIAVQDAVAAHHALANGASVPVPLSEVVQAADRYVKSIGASILQPPAALQADPSPFEELGLSETQIASLLTEFDAEYQQTASFFA